MARLSVHANTQLWLQALLEEGTLSGLTDGALLDRLATPGDPSAAAAFAVLVERHGPMVLRVCQRELEDPHDAEDAFQATFLVFFRRAGSIRNRGSLASWLFGVAHRVACRARKQTRRRQGHERRYAEQAPGESQSLDKRSETWPEIHEELASLPERLRSPVVLCYLEGLTAEAAALRLGCPRGTVLSRLSTARERLRDRLSRRGVGLPAGLLTAGLATSTTEAAVPATLASSLVRTVLSITSEKTMATATSPAVAALTQGVLNMMWCARLIRVAAALAAIVVVAAVKGVVVRRPAQSARQDAPASGAARAPAPVSKSPSLPEKDAKAGEARKAGRRTHRPRGRPVQRRRPAQERLHEHGRHRPRDRKMADDLQRPLVWSHLSRRTVHGLRQRRQQPCEVPGRPLGPRPYGPDASAADLRPIRISPLVAQRPEGRDQRAGGQSAGKVRNLARSMWTAAIEPGCRFPKRTWFWTAPAMATGSRRGIKEPTRTIADG